MTNSQDFFGLCLGFTIMFITFIIFGFLISLILVITGIACFLSTPVVAICLAIESNPYHPDNDEKSSIEKGISALARKEYRNSEKPPEPPRFYGV